MTSTPNPYCQPLLDFNRVNTDKIKDLCAPLDRHLGITAFFYIRIFDNGRYLLVSNNALFLEIMAVHDSIFKSDYFRQQTARFCKYEPMRDLWPDDVQDDAMDFLRFGGLFNGFTIAKEFNGSLEACTFSNNDAHSAIKEFYRKHTNILDDFMTHFRNIGGDLTNPDGPAKLGISPHLSKAYPQINKIFSSTTPWERDIIDFNESQNVQTRQAIYETGKRHSLSPRELQCLSYMTAGYTVKEIARIIQISPRTVETYLISVRLKTECNDRRELTQWFQEAFRPFLGNTTNRLIL